MNKKTSMSATNIMKNASDFIDKKFTLKIEDYLIMCIVTYNSSSSWHYKDLVRVHDCVQSVSDCQHCAICKLAPDCALDQGIRPSTKHHHVIGPNTKLFLKWTLFFLKAL